MNRPGRTLRLILCLLICLVTTAAMPVAAPAQTEELLIGIEPEHNIFDQMERYRYLAGYLSEQLGVEVKLTIMSRYGEVIKRFKSLRLDGAFLTSYTATMGINELQLEPVVNPVNPNGESTSQGYIFVRKDSGIRDVKDMRGKSIVFVDPATMEGYLFPLAYLERHGVTDINEFFNRFYFSGSHVSAIFAVLDGRADIGAAKNTVFNRLVANDPSIAQELDIIARSPKVPEITLCIRNEIDRDLREKLAEVLLHMDKTSEGRKVLERFKALGFVKSRKADFIGIEEMEQEARTAMGNTEK
ncbi:MAG: phosphate/phosphite/phosphonate ABC transporter substrate-binding protein [Proteobacteria bacterium]|nr:phosphate/phosphite/phosphonate ABC transporter substrate-binding protein [Pseudomonadota bacterium]MBU4295537.1 phosphate/phosphite/phosphonate ABC transporter substrate-binding protein [Pseudomonadota bacterium]MCG2748413.1 phosphate/phosphite/phosphonate ABC transporter substrate-binding protein [Desulfobulbaceae bacterium]